MFYTKLTRCLRYRIEDRWDCLQSKGKTPQSRAPLIQAHEEQP